MKQIVKTADKIMKEAKAYTGWNFVGAVKGNACTIRADLANDADKKVKVIMEIIANDVHIKVVGMDERFDEQSVEMVYGKLDFPVEVEIGKGKSFQVSYHEPLGVLEHSVKGVMAERVVPMVNLIAGMLED